MAGNMELSSAEVADITSRVASTPGFGSDDKSKQDKPKVETKPATKPVETAGDTKPQERAARPSGKTETTAPAAAPVVAEPAKAADPDAFEPGKHVDYARAKQLRDERDDARKQLKTFEQQIAQQKADFQRQMDALKAAHTVQGQPQQTAGKPKVDAETAAMLREFGIEVDDDKPTQSQTAGLPPEVQQLIRDQGQRLKAMETQHELAKLKSEIATVQAKYPDVPQKALINALRLDDKADLMAVAEDYAADVAKWKAAGASSVNAQAQAAAGNPAPPPVPSRPQKAGAASTAQTEVKHDLKSRKGVRDATSDVLRKAGWSL
jgi:hypothetical protein